MNRFHFFFFLTALVSSALAPLSRAADEGALTFGTSSPISTTEGGTIRIIRSESPGGRLADPAQLLGGGMDAHSGVPNSNGVSMSMANSESE